jgi:hypothetical protein
MPSFVYDLRYLQAGADVLENFLLASEIYWPIGVGAPEGEAPYPQLTLGGLLLAQARATVKALSPVEQRQLDQVSERMGEIRRLWRAAWATKASGELRGRLVQWRNFLEDYRENRQANDDRFRYEVFRRVIIELLLPDAEALTSAESEMLDSLDGLLKAVLKPAGFIWEAELASAFPKQPYWFLYGYLPGE